MTLVPLGILAGLAAADALALRFWAQRVERIDIPAPKRVAKLRSAMILAVMFLALLTGFLLRASHLPEAPDRSLLSHFPALRGTSLYYLHVIVVFGIVAALAGLVLGQAAPSIRRIRGTEKTPAPLAIRSAAVAIFRVLVIWFALWDGVNRPGGPWTALTRVGALALLWAGSPWLFKAALEVYPPDRDTQSRLLGMCRQHGLEVRDVLFFKSRRSRCANAFFTGILPRHRYIFISDYLVDSLSSEELDAVMTHEIAHGKGRDPLLRLGILAAAIPVRFLPMGAILSVGLIYLALLVGIPRSEIRADNYAVTSVGAGPMYAALLRLCELNHLALQSRTNIAARQAARRLKHLKALLPLGVHDPATQVQET